MKELKELVVGLMAFFLLLTMVYSFFYTLLCSGIPQTSRYKCKHYARTVEIIDTYISKKIVNET